MNDPLSKPFAQITPEEWLWLASLYSLEQLDGSDLELYEVALLENEACQEGMASWLQLDSALSTIPQHEVALSPELQLKSDPSSLANTSARALFVRPARVLISICLLTLVVATAGFVIVRTLSSEPGASPVSKNANFDERLLAQNWLELSESDLAGMQIPEGGASIEDWDVADSDGSEQALDTFVVNLSESSSLDDVGELSWIIEALGELEEAGDEFEFN